MQVHLLGRDAVDAPLGLANQLERPERAFLHPIRDRRPLDQLDELTDMPAVRLLGNLEIDLLAGDAGAAYVSNRNTHVPYAEPPRQLLKPRHGHAQRQEGP